MTLTNVLWAEFTDPTKQNPNIIKLGKSCSELRVVLDPVLWHCRHLYRVFVKLSVILGAEH